MREILRQRRMGVNRIRGKPRDFPVTGRDKVDVSNRVMAYCEGEMHYLPVHLSEPLAKAPGVSTDELMGLEKTRKKEGLKTPASAGGNSARWKNCRRSVSRSCRFSMPSWEVRR
jgi:hypothetical protein